MFIFQYGCVDVVFFFYLFNFFVCLEYAQLFLVSSIPTSQDYLAIFLSFFSISSLAIVLMKKYLGYADICYKQDAETDERRITANRQENRSHE